MKNYYLFGFRTLFALVVLLCVTVVHIQAQTKVSGVIQDADSGESLPGVNILIKGTQEGTITGFDGTFNVTPPSEEAILVISFVGYTTQEIVVGSRSVIDVRLVMDYEQLSEVVVIGYGEIEKDDATGSVVAVSTKDFNKGAITSPQELLMGKVPGVAISAPTGQPGGSSTIRIRGGSSLSASNDPLIVIDGVPITNEGIDGFANPLATINPNDIESFTVLKDASATAIYGSRASNGVIIVTTKSGTAGQKMQISYNGNAAIGVPIKYVDVYNGEEYRALIDERALAGETGMTEAQAIVGDQNTDWQKEVLENSFSMDHNIAVTGSINKKTPFRASIGYTDQQGMVKESRMQRTTLGISVSPSLLNDNLKFNINVKGMLTDNNFSKDGALSSAVSFDPTQSIYDTNSEYGGFYTWTSEDGTPNFIATTNPVAEIQQSENTSQVLRSIGNMNMSYTLPFVSGLKANLNVGYDYYETNGTDNIAADAAFGVRNPESNVKSYEMTGGNELLDFYLNYNKNLESIASKLDLTGGYSYQHFHSETINKNRPWEQNDGVYVGSDTTVNKTENYLISFFGRANYTLKGRYLLTATLRQDGSSRFAEDNRWGLFPSAALAWKINEESFLVDVEAISVLKLRAGWGVTGQQDIPGGDYPALAQYTGSQSAALYRLGDTFYTMWKPVAYDPNIKWEETTTKNIGLDFGLFNERITGSFDYYHRTTDDLINEVPIPVGVNFSDRVITNVGSMVNKGYEIALSGYIISTPDISWNLSVNYTKNINEITKLTSFEDPDYIGYQVGSINGGSDNKVQINSVGYPANTFFLFQQIYDADGMPIEGLYVDKTGNGGNVTGNDLNRYYTKTPTPDFLMGISSQFKYKNIDFSFSGRLSIGNYVYNNVDSDKAIYANLYNQSVYTSNIVKSVEKSGFENAQYISDFYLEDGSFFRMDNIAVGYNIEKLFSDKLSARVSFTVNNAFLITDYSGIDPEINNATDPGIDKNIYPRPRTFVLGFNVNF